VQAAAAAEHPAAVPVVGRGADPSAVADAAGRERYRSAAVVAGLAAEQEAAPAGDRGWAGPAAAAVPAAPADPPAAALAEWWRAEAVAWLLEVAGARQARSVAAAAQAAADGRRVVRLPAAVPAAAGAPPGAAAWLEAAAWRPEAAVAHPAVADEPPGAAEDGCREAARAALVGREQRVLPPAAAAPARPAQAQTNARLRPLGRLSTKAVRQKPEAHLKASLAPNKNSVGDAHAPFPQYRRKQLRRPRDASWRGTSASNAGPHGLVPHHAMRVRSAECQMNRSFSTPTQHAVND
jgi:hypothetical protein